MATQKTSMTEQAPTTTQVVTIDPEAIAAITRATAEAFRQTMKPENATPPAGSFGNGAAAPGVPAAPGFPTLKWETVYQYGAKVRPEDLTKEETRLLNEIAPVAGSYGPDKAWSTQVRDDGKTLVLNVRDLGTIEVRMNMPSFATVLRTIVEEQRLVAA